MKLISKLTLGIIIVALMTGLVFSAAQAEKAEIVFTANFPNSPKSAVIIGMEAASEYISENTNGRIQLNVFHSSQLGSQATALTDLDQGKYDVTLFAPADMGRYYEPVGILQVPYLLRSPEHMLAVSQSDVGQELYKGFEDTCNIKVLQTIYFGTRHLTSNIPGTTPDDFSGVKMRIFDAPMAYEWARALGTTPTPIPFTELYLALQTGTVDAQENPLLTIYAQGFYEVQDYLILTNHLIGGPSICMNKDSWERIPEDLREVFLDGIRHGAEVNNNLVFEQEANFIDELEGLGMKIIKPDLEPFLENVRSIYEKYDTDLIKRIQAVEYK